MDPARVAYDPLSFLFRRFRSFPSDDFSCWTATCSTFEPVYNSNPTTNRYSLWRNGSSLNVLPFVETPEGLLVETIYTNKGIRTNLINGSPMEITRHCFMTTALSFSSGASEIQLGSPGKCPGHPCAVGKPAQINELEMSENYKWDAPERRVNVQTPIQTLIINWGNVWLRLIDFFFFFFLFRLGQNEHGGFVCQNELSEWQEKERLVRRTGFKETNCNIVWGDRKFINQTIRLNISFVCCKKYSIFFLTQQ